MVMRASDCIIPGLFSGPGDCLSFGFGDGKECHTSVARYFSFLRLIKLVIGGLRDSTTPMADNFARILYDH